MYTADTMMTVLKYINDNPGITRRGIQRVSGMTNTVINKYVTKAVNCGYVQELPIIRGKALYLIKQADPRDFEDVTVWRKLRPVNPDGNFMIGDELYNLNHEQCKMIKDLARTFQSINRSVQS